MIETERKEKLADLDENYRRWYRKALSMFSSYDRTDLEEPFMKEYEGSWISQKIKKFLDLGWKIYPYYDAEKENPIIPKWTVSFERSFKSPLEKQCDLLSVLGKKSQTLEKAGIEQKDDLVVEDDSEWNKAFQAVRNSIAESSIEPKLKEISIYDLEQAQIVYKAKAYKGCIVMLGAVLEAIMLGTLRRIDVIQEIQILPDPPPTLKKIGVHDPKFADEIAQTLSFEDCKNTLHHLIPELEKDKVESIQAFRNAIHPWKTVTDPVIYADPDQIRAMNHITSLAILTHYILQWIPAKQDVLE